MQIVCQEKKVVVAQAKISCEELLVAIVQDKRAADEQEKQVTTGAARQAASTCHLQVVLSLGTACCQPLKSGLLLAVGRQQQPSSHGYPQFCRKAGSRACIGGLRVSLCLLLSQQQPAVLG